MKRGYYTLFLWIIWGFLYSQDYPKDFTSPIDLPLRIVGNFGELRKNHFHSGLDLRTNEEEGHNIYSIGDGFISRINVSSTGYGNTLYIDHPNGYTSVYAHLKEFNSIITEYVKTAQYKQQKSEIELLPEKGKLEVKKGDLIALSGNSGASQGPHLHFEIRDTKTEDPINPFLFGFDVSDKKPPLLSHVYIYPIEGKIEGKIEKFSLAKDKKEISGYGKFGVGIKAFDQHDFLDNWNGIYSIKVTANDKEIFLFKATQVSFSRPRLINMSTDYSAFLNGNWIYKCFKTEGNDLKMIKNSFKNGYIQLETGKTLHIKIEVADFAGNQTTKEFNITGIEGNLTPPQEDASSFSYNKENRFKNENIELIFKKGVFSENINFHFKEISDGYEIHDSNYPALDYFAIKAMPKGIAQEDYNKTIFVRYSKKGKGWKKEYEGGSYENGKIVKNVRDFGIYKFEVDKQAPVITSRIPKSKKVTNQIRFSIVDGMSGIDNYNVFIDEKWTAVVYDKKYHSLTINLDSSITTGKHILRIEVIDKVKNKSETIVEFEKI